MPNVLTRYTRWLHTRWPAGGVEKLPEVGEDGATSVPGVRIVGDLTGIPLLKLSLDTGARAVQAFLREPGFGPPGEGAGDEARVDVAVVGAGVSGISAAIEAKKAGLSVAVFEATRPFSTIENFPKGKPIYTYPTDMTPAGTMHVRADVKESLLDELEAQRREADIEPEHARITRIERSGEELILHLDGGGTRRARRVVVAIGRTGNYRTLGVPGESLDKVYNRLYDPADHAGRDVLVVGGGDSALESAIALTRAGARVTLSYRGTELSRPKPENVEQVRALSGSLRLALGTEVRSIAGDHVVLETGDGEERLPNDVVFSMIGREAPLGFFRRSGIRIRGELSARAWVAMLAFVAFIALVYLWKAWWIGGTSIFRLSPTSGDAALDDVLARATGDPGSWFTLAYTACIVGFGIARIRRRRTPYVTRQTLVLMAFQVVPLFILPVLVLPYLDARGWMPAAIQENLFPDGSYWRAYGLILAWPLFLWNLATSQPLMWWVAIGLVQTFVIIPLIVWRWGKGAYCGWVCSCGALAETMGDRHRQKMWHGPVANRWNMTGQVVLALAVIVTLLHVLGWSPSFHAALAPLAEHGATFYKAAVDIAIGGALGLGLYFWFSGRVWCRFACPLAALMHVYARFSRFRIFAEKKKCISCNVCTSVCHQGIDVMSFANKGLPMKDPQCVRCSACVQSCPTGVLSFGHVDGDGRAVHDRVAASPVRMRERAET